MSRTHRHRRCALPTLMLAMALAVTFAIPASAQPVDDVQVIVEAVPGGLDAASEAVDALGGAIIRELPIINGFSATIGEDRLAALAGYPSVMRIGPDTHVYLLGDERDDDWEKEFDTDDVVVTLTTTEEAKLEAELIQIEATAGSAGFEAVAGEVEAELLAVEVPTGDMLSVTTSLGARAYWEAGYDGSGVDVAIIDTGVAPVAGLTGTGKVINGIDLSFESQLDELRYMDTYGHGTHLAGIIGGADGPADAFGPVDEFLGMAPGSRLISVKVADSHGAVDVSQVIAAIDWIVQHRNDNGMNIRVLNLSFGTDGQQSYKLDPLAHAVEVAWHNGIVVVVAAGNDGPGSLRNPAFDPLVIAVGAVDNGGTRDSADDVVQEFSSCDTGRNPDVLAPGRSILSLRVPGSSADLEHPDAQVGDRLFKGSGTSQAAAVVSGAVALIIDQYPAATPDQVKYLLMKTADPVDGDRSCTGYGVIDLFQALDVGAGEFPTSWQRSSANGTGSLEDARGSMHLESDGVTLEGEQDIFGNEFDTEYQAKLRRNDMAWSGGTFNGASWSGASWSGASWSGASWSGASWSGASWSGASWSGASWSGASWSGASWSGASWSGASWSGASWSGASWSSNGWLGLSWN